MNCTEYKMDVPAIRERMEEMRENLRRRKNTDDLIGNGVLVITWRLIANPMSYFEYGPYWFALKEVLGSHGLFLGTCTERAIAGAYRGETEEMTLVMAETFRELYKERWAPGTRAFALDPEIDFEWVLSDEDFAPGGFAWDALARANARLQAQPSMDAQKKGASSTAAGESVRKELTPQERMNAVRRIRRAIKTIKEAEAALGVPAEEKTAPRMILNTLDRAKVDGKFFSLFDLLRSELRELRPEHVLRFIELLPESDAVGLIDETGAPTRKAQERMATAIIDQAYGNDELTRIMGRALSFRQRRIIDALIDAAGEMHGCSNSGFGRTFVQCVAHAAVIILNDERNPLKSAEEFLSSSPLSLFDDPLDEPSEGVRAVMKLFTRTLPDETCDLGLALATAGRAAELEGHAAEWYGAAPRKIAEVMEEALYLTGGEFGFETLDAPNPTHEEAQAFRRRLEVNIRQAQKGALFKQPKDFNPFFNCDACCRFMSREGVGLVNRRGAIRLHALLHGVPKEDYDETIPPAALVWLSAERTKRAMALRLEGVAENRIREELARTLPYEGVLLEFDEGDDAGGAY